MERQGRSRQRRGPSPSGLPDRRTVRGSPALSRSVSTGRSIPPRQPSRGMPGRPGDDRGRRLLAGRQRPTRGRRAGPPQCPGLAAVGAGTCAAHQRCDGAGSAARLGGAPQARAGPGGSAPGRLGHTRGGVCRPDRTGGPGHRGGVGAAAEQARPQPRRHGAGGDGAGARAGAGHPQRAALPRPGRARAGPVQRDPGDRGRCSGAFPYRNPSPA